jgi:soluble cytochrome b562
MEMLRRVAIGVALACIMGGTAYAVDEDVDNECTRQLSAAEEAVQNKIDANALNDDEAEKVNELLDQADALCTEGNFKDASAALAQVNDLISKK